MTIKEINLINDLFEWLAFTLILVWFLHSFLEFSLGKSDVLLQLNVGLL